MWKYSLLTIRASVEPKLALDVDMVGACVAVTFALVGVTVPVLFVSAGVAVSFDDGAVTFSFVGASVVVTIVPGGKVSFVDTAVKPAVTPEGVVELLS